MSESAQSPAPQEDRNDQRPAPNPGGQTHQLSEAGASTMLPQYRVLLHNPECSDMLDVIEALVDLTPLNVQRATSVMLEAHASGVALVLVTHQERAELYVEQFRAKSMKVTIEPAA